MSLLRSLCESSRRQVGAKICLKDCIFYEQKRRLNVHEYISYKLLEEAGLPVPKYGVATTKQDVPRILNETKIVEIVLKAQVLSGGRGKGTFKNGMKSGVQLVSNAKDAEEIAGKMLGEVLVTKQTGEKGILCKKVMVTERKKAHREYYVAVMMERSYNGPVLMASGEGGVEIEDVVKKNPDAVLYIPIDIDKGLQMEAAEKMAEKIGLGDKRSIMGKYMVNMYNLFIKKDATLVEINPFIQDQSGHFFCLDAKLNFDDSAFFRQKELFGMRDRSQEDIKEVIAQDLGINYIILDGNIGCMVNGAGLAMATCDILKLQGGNPANFLDVGGGSDVHAIKEAFKILAMDEKVKVVFVHIFGGILRCDIIANGLVQALKEVKLKVPIIIRLEGTSVTEAKSILAASDIKMMMLKDFEEAAKVSVGVANIVTSGPQHTVVKMELPL